MADQNYSNHRRLHFWYHFVLVPIFTINGIVALVLAGRERTLLSFWNAAVALALIGMSILLRTYGLRNQDRIIRLEERVLTGEIKGRDAIKRAVRNWRPDNRRL